MTASRFAAISRMLCPSSECIRWQQVHLITRLVKAAVDMLTVHEVEADVRGSSIGLAGTHRLACAVPLQRVEDACTALTAGTS